MTKRRPPYPAEFRQQMIELVRAGNTPAELSRQFECTAQTIATGWRRQTGYGLDVSTKSSVRPSLT